MPLSISDLRLLEQACANRRNKAALSLLNAYGATNAAEILSHIAGSPLTLRSQFMEHVREAIEEQRRLASGR